MRVAPFIMLAFMGSACAVTRDVVMLDPAAPMYTPVSPDSVYIFANSSRILLDYEAIATISASTTASGLVAPDLTEMLTALREMAGGLGADAIILSGLQGQQASGTTDGVPASASGTAVRLRGNTAQDPSLAVAARRIEGIRVIALSPVVRGDSLPMADTIRSLFEQDIRATLLAHGFNTVSGSVYDSVRTAHVVDLGGLFDPFTGQRYDDRAMLAEQRTRQTLIDEHGVDGFLIQEIWNTPEYYSPPAPEWDETRQRVVVPEDRAWEREPEYRTLDCPAGDRCVGMLRALSFMVRLENSFGAMLYTGRGGIEFWELLDDARKELYLLPPPHRFDRAEGNREAVALALERLVQGGN